MLETIARLGTGAIQRVQIPLSETALMGGVNVHLLTGPEGLVVLDFGPPGALAAPIWQRLLPHIQGFDGPVRLLASHMHGDHIGMALPVARAVGVGLEMAVPEWAEAALRLEREGAGHATVEADFLSACGILAPLPCQQKPFEIRLPPRGPDLLPGQTLRMAGAEWQAVMTPGHSAAMTCFHQAEADLILSGDTLLPGVVPVTIPDLYRPDHDPVGDLIDSLTMLERRGIVGAKTGLLPGHGDPQSDALAHLIRIRGALEKRNARLASALQDVGAASLWALLPQVFRNGQQSDGHMALRLLVVLGHLRHLARTGRAVLDRQPDGTWRARGVYGRIQRIG